MIGDSNEPSTIISTVVQEIQERPESKDFMFCNVLSLRSPEGLIMDLGALTKHNSRPTIRSKVIIPLLGRVNGKYHTRHHLLASTPEAFFGIRV